jgi:hypothetical protein
MVQDLALKMEVRGSSFEFCNLVGETNLGSAY